MSTDRPAAEAGPVTGRPAPAPVPARVEAATRVSVNGEERLVEAGTALDALVAGFSSASSGVAAAVNETVVPRAQWPHTALAEGDRIEILTAVQGG